MSENEWIKYHAVTELQAVLIEEESRVASGGSIAQEWRDKMWATAETLFIVRAVLLQL